MIQSRTEADGTVVITVMVDTLDRLTAAEFREQASPILAASCGPVEVDCKMLEFIDSSGVGAFLHANKLLPAERRPVRLTGVGTKILTLLELMHVHRSFDLEARV
jgi:anti-sigma B factor antagonist